MKKIMKRMSSKKAEKGGNSNVGFESGDVKDNSVNMDISASSLVVDSKSKEEVTPQLKQQLSSSTLSVSSSQDANTTTSSKSVSSSLDATSSKSANSETATNAISSPVKTPATTATNQSVVKNVPSITESATISPKNKEDKLEKLRKKQEERQQTLQSEAASPIILLPDANSNVPSLALADPAQAEEDSLVKEQINETGLDALGKDDAEILLKPIEKQESTTREKPSPCAEFVCCM